MSEAEKHDSGTEKPNSLVQTPCILKELWPPVKHFSAGMRYHSNEYIKEFPPKLVVVLCNFSCKSMLNETINIWKNYVPSFEKLGCKISFSLPCTTEEPSIEEIDQKCDLEKLYINCAINKSLFGTNGESYSIMLGVNTQLLARDQLGLHRAIQTLVQIYSSKDLPQMTFQPITIHDNPSFSYRALKINLSLNSLKIMKKETLHHLIEGISLLKFSQLQLVCCVDPQTGTDCWPMTLSAMEVIELDLFCSQWGLCIVPELDASPNSVENDLDTLRQIYTKVLQCFPQPKYVSLGSQLIKLLSSVSDFAIGIDAWTKYLPVNLNESILLLNQSVNNIVDKDLFRTILVSKNTSNYYVEKIQRNIVSFDCSSKNSLGGCLKSFIPELKDSIVNASQQPGCLGIIINLTIDNFFLPLSLCLPGIISIAGLTWNVNAFKSNEEINDAQKIIESVINRHILQDTDEIIGKTIIDLGQIEADLAFFNCKSKDNYEEVSLLYLLLTNPDLSEFDRDSAVSIQKGIRSISQVQLSLHRSQISCSQSGEILSELQLVADLMLLASRLGKSLITAGANPDSTLGVCVINAGIANLPSTARTDLANRLLGLMDQYRAVWLSRHFPNNLPAAMLSLQELLNKLVPEDFSNDV